MKRKCAGSGGRPAAALLTAVLALVLVLAGCDDGGGSSDSGSGGTDGGGVSFTLAKAGSNGFTITVAGADWKSTLNGRITQEAMSANADIAQLGSFLNWSGLTINNNSGLSDIVKPWYFNYSVSGKVLTAAAVTADGDAYKLTAISGALKFTANTTALKTLARIITTASTADSATGSPAAGITF